MHIGNIKYFSTVNGEGVRTAVFVTGCRFHCPGCFNTEAWNFNYGKEMTSELIYKILRSIEPEYIEGLTILGGEPLEPENLNGVITLIDHFRAKFGDTKNIWLYTGYYLDDAIVNTKRNEILNKCDYIVDGPYVGKLKDASLAFRGSSNQTIYHRVDQDVFEVVE